jgi:hypothetical protein
MKEIKRDALAHYDRMIKWAEKQDPKGFVNHLFMYRDIGETWYSDYCPYCKKYPGCEKCPLEKHKKCCDGLWSEMNKQPTWGKWIEAAKKVRKYIKKYG